ncbi:MAG: RNA polymerase sigma factor [Nitrospira sp.]|nr:RNA polymerase sigma factor [Nitrospira sp.]
MIPSSSTIKPSCLAETEAVVVLRLRQGDEEAFQEVVNQHHGVLIRIAMTYVADREMAKDVVQDTWIAVIESLNCFEGRSSLRTWICRILIHKALDRRAREKRRRTPAAAGYQTLSSRSWDDRTPENLLASRQAVHAMQHAIECLPVGLKSVLILRDRDGVDATQVCRMLNIKTTNMYVRLHRARERVKVAVQAALG